jgi:hypothetical protein
LDETNCTKWVFAIKMFLSDGVADFAEDPDNIGLDLVIVKKAAAFGRAIVSNCSELSSMSSWLTRVASRCRSICRNVTLGCTRYADCRDSRTWLNQILKNVVEVKRLTRKTYVANGSKTIGLEDLAIATLCPQAMIQ